MTHLDASQITASLQRLFSSNGSPVGRLANHSVEVNRSGLRRVAGTTGILASVRSLFSRATTWTQAGVFGRAQQTFQLRTDNVIRDLVDFGAAQTPERKRLLADHIVKNLSALQAAYTEMRTANPGMAESFEEVLKLRLDALAGKLDSGDLKDLEAQLGRLAQDGIHKDLHQQVAAAGGRRRGEELGDKPIVLDYLISSLQKTAAEKSLADASKRIAETITDVLAATPPPNETKPAELVRYSMAFDQAVQAGCQSYLSLRSLTGEPPAKSKGDSHSWAYQKVAESLATLPKDQRQAFLTRLPDHPLLMLVRGSADAGTAEVCQELAELTASRHAALRQQFSQHAQNLPALAGDSWDKILAGDNTYADALHLAVGSYRQVGEHARDFNFEGPLHEQDLEKIRQYVAGLAESIDPARLGALEPEALANLGSLHRSAGQAAKYLGAPSDLAGKMAPCFKAAEERVRAGVTSLATGIFDAALADDRGGLTHALVKLAIDGGERAAALLSQLQGDEVGFAADDLTEISANAIEAALHEASDERLQGIHQALHNGAGDAVARGLDKLSSQAPGDETGYRVAFTRALFEIARKAASQELKARNLNPPAAPPPPVQTEEETIQELIGQKGADTVRDAFHLLVDGNNVTKLPAEAVHHALQ